MRRSEQQIHLAIAEHLRLRAVPGLLWWHTPNEGVRSPGASRVLGVMGLLPGVADLLFLHAGRFYSLELKTAGGRARPAQLRWRASVLDAGGEAALAHGVDEALARLDGWGLLRPARVGPNQEHNINCKTSRR